MNTDLSSAPPSVNEPYVLHTFSEWALCTSHFQWMSPMYFTLSVDEPYVLHTFSGWALCASHFQWMSPMCLTLSVDEPYVLHIFSGWALCASHFQWMSPECFTLSVNEPYVLHTFSGWALCASHFQWMSPMCLTLSVDEPYVLHTFSGWALCASHFQWMSPMCFTLSVDELYVLHTFSGWALWASHLLTLSYCETDNYTNSAVLCFQAHPLSSICMPLWMSVCSFTQCFWIFTQVVYLQGCSVVTWLVPWTARSLADAMWNCCRLAAGAVCTWYNHAPVYSVTLFKAMLGSCVFICNLPPPYAGVHYTKFTCLSGQVAISHTAICINVTINPVVCLLW